MSLITLEKPATAEARLWPRLHQLRLGSAAVDDRSKGIGGSDANIIVSGDSDRIRELWLEKRGEGSPPDLSDVLAVMLGCWTEEFNRQWFEKVTQQSVGRVGKALCCSRHEWRRCTLDGFVADVPAVFEAKHTNAFASSEEVTSRYMPQLQHAMAVAGVERALLSVISATTGTSWSRSRPTGSTSSSSSRRSKSSGTAW